MLKPSTPRCAAGKVATLRTASITAPTVAHCAMPQAADSDSSTRDFERSFTSRFNTDELHHMSQQTTINTGRWQNLCGKRLCASRSLQGA